MSSMSEFAIWQHLARQTGGVASQWPAVALRANKCQSERSGEGGGAKICSMKDHVRFSFPLFATVGSPGSPDPHGRSFLTFDQSWRGV